MEYSSLEKFTVRIIHRSMRTAEAILTKLVTRFEPSPKQTVTLVRLPLPEGLTVTIQNRYGE